MTAYAPFTPSNSGQRLPPTYYRGCWHVVKKSAYVLFRRLVGSDMCTRDSINHAVQMVETPYLGLLNDDMTVVTPDWIEAMLEHAQREEVGAVGCRLVYPDGRTQHEGIGLGNICAASTAVNLDAGWLGRVVRDVSAVTGACQMVRAAVYDEVGGYDESLHVAYNDVDFCLRVRATGRVVVYTPHAELCHRESASRGGLDPLADRELFWRPRGRMIESELDLKLRRV